MNFVRQSVTSCAIAILLGSSSVMAADDALAPIQQQWAVCQYQQTGKAKESCLETLSTQAEAASAKEPFRADLLIWSAIVKSTWAGAKGGLGALGLVKEAKAKLELALKQALAINPDGIDPNFFYGDSLLDQGRKAAAKTSPDKALAAPARPGRELADEGRRMEIRDRLAKL